MIAWRRPQTDLLWLLHAPPSPPARKANRFSGRSRRVTAGTSPCAARDQAPVAGAAARGLGRGPVRRWQTIARLGTPSHRWPSSGPGSPQPTSGDLCGGRTSEEDQRGQGGVQRPALLGLRGHRHASSVPRPYDRRTVPRRTLGLGRAEVSSRRKPRSSGGQPAARQAWRGVGGLRISGPRAARGAFSRRRRRTPLPRAGCHRARNGWSFGPGSCRCARQDGRVCRQAGTGRIGPALRAWRPGSRSSLPALPGGVGDLPRVGPRRARCARLGGLSGRLCKGLTV